MKGTTNLEFFEPFKELAKIRDEEPILEDKADREAKKLKKGIGKATKTFDQQAEVWVRAILNCEWNLGYSSEGETWYSMYPKSPDYRLPPPGARSDPDVTVDDINHRWKYNHAVSVSINYLQDQAKEKFASKPKQYRDLDMKIHELVRTNQKFEDLYWEVKDPEELLKLSEQEASKIVFEKYRVQGYVLKNFIKEVIKLL